MPYVLRTAEGAITGLFAIRQPGSAEEYLPDDDPDVVAFLAPRALPWWRRRKDLYRERIAAYKGVADASHQDVLGFVADATIKALGGDGAELNEIATIVQGVKSDVPKPE